MNIICSKSLLNEAVSAANKAVSSKSTIASLEGILLTAQNGFLKVCGYDLEMGIESKIEAEVDKSGSVVVNSRIFSEIVRKLPEESVNISVDDKNIVTIKSGLFISSIMGIPADDFPQIPVVEGEKSFSIAQNILKDMLKQTIYAVSLSDTRPILTGALFDFNNGVLKIVGSDGFRLSLRKENINIMGDFNFVVPHKALNEILKILKEDDSEIHISVARKHILFTFDNVSLISRLLEGNFIDYEKVIPKNTKTKIKLKTKDFIDSVERVSLLISEKIKNPVRCSFEYDTAKVFCKTALGNGNDEFSCEIEGDGLEIGFNGKYITDALRNCNDSEVYVELTSNLLPIVIKPIENDSYLYLVVPMRYKVDE